MLFENDKRNLIGGLAAITAFAGALLGYAFIEANDFGKNVVVVAEKLENKVHQDLLESSTVPLRDDYVMDITHINLDSKDMLVGYVSNTLDVYGILDETYAFKNSYKLTPEQFNALHKSGTDAEVIRRLGNVFDSLELSKQDFTDLNAISLGFTNEEDLEKFTNILGPAVENEDFFKAEYNTTPDMFMPVYSSVNVKEKDGKTYAVLDVEGFDVYKRNTPNFGIGMIYGNMMYTATQSFAMSYAYGMSMAYATAIEKCNTYAREERFVTEVDAEKANLSSEELRSYLVTGIMEDSLEYEKGTISLSENLHFTNSKAYSRMNDLEK